MKKILLLVLLFSQVKPSIAQRFFYVESGNAAEKPLQNRLLSASQFVTKSPLTSDYIIKTEMHFEKDRNTSTVKIILEDSITLKPIFQTNEDYAFGDRKVDSKILLDMAMATMIEKNINRMIRYAKMDHLNPLMSLPESTQP